MKWKRIKGNEYIVAFTCACESDDMRLVVSVSDFSNLYTTDYSRKDLIRDNPRFNECEFREDVILDWLYDTLKQSPGDNFSVCAIGDREVRLNFGCEYLHREFKWEFLVPVARGNQFLKYVMEPPVRLVLDLLEQREELFRLLEAKDVQIHELESSGEKLKTLAFDKKTFVDGFRLENAFEDPLVKLFTQNGISLDERCSKYFSNPGGSQLTKPAEKSAINDVSSPIKSGNAPPKPSPRKVLSQEDKIKRRRQLASELKAGHTKDSGKRSKKCARYLKMPSVTFSDERLPSRSTDVAVDAYTHSSNDVVHLKLVRNAADFEDEEKEFNPGMTHQIYGADEEIFGFKTVDIKLFFTAANLRMFLKIKASDPIKDSSGKALPSVVSRLAHFFLRQDDLEKPLRMILPKEGIMTNPDDFLKLLDEEHKFKPFGSKVHSFTREDNDGSYEIYRCDLITSPGFLEFHERLQTFVLLFIDGGSYIDTDDDKWQFFILYEKYKDETGVPRYAVAGYSTIYEYYAYPDKRRPRISQFLILPPFQRFGLGTELLRSVYRYYQCSPLIVDITVEDPSDEFQMLRHYVDSSMCRELPAFQPALLKKGFTKEMCLQANENFKLNPKQVRRVYEILRLGVTNLQDPADLKEYRLDIKKRLFSMNKENSRALKFNATSNKDIKELLMTTCNPDVMKQQLKELYDSVFPIYLEIWSKVERSGKH
ncbi:unnamed protein product [Notodromas monacha]|uniref:Histone acetyltransferase type B catalytic subunit n=1 Tax=Notodromas monacha TaxID=399045 RepID=A0A7R9BL01_9CRUS|nr:unnamed protein product [Notodromas monacha]CAG0915935.1 unnamed protein product [Notodromas monacha]